MTQARHLGATKTEPARYLSEVASAVGRVFYGRDATCWQPYVKGLTIAANSIFNGWHMEDVLAQQFAASGQRGPAALR